MNWRTLMGKGVSNPFRDLMGFLMGCSNWDCEFLVFFLRFQWNLGCNGSVFVDVNEMQL